MFKKKETDYPKVCLYCENATILKDSTDVLCRLKGAVSEDYCCRKFVYDPLKRVPSAVNPLPAIDPEDLI